MSQTWIEKPSILLTESKLLEFIPNNETTYPEKLNALTRFIIATAIIIALIRRELFVLLIPLCCMVVIYFLTKWGLNLSEIKEKFYPDDNKVNKEDCQLPSVDNPFMNVLPTDNRDRKEACTTNDMKENINNKFEFNLYKNIGDVFGNENSQRQFYTMPSTTIPNNRKDFADWLYKTPPTCKEQGLCFTPKTTFDL